MPDKWYNKFRRITSNQLYFPEIDGIRFLAIVLVIVFHTHGYFIKKTNIAFSDGSNGHEWVDNLLANGDRGVELFFVLSGFILCMPFAHHYINNGKKVILKKYYLRRVTRLEPPYILAMTGIFLLQLLMHLHPVSVLLPHWLASLVYAHGIIYEATPLLTVVAWSLEIEIQFYVIAPLLFRLLTMPAMLRRIVLLCMIIGMAVMQHYYMPGFLKLNIYSFAQYFLAGILLADFYVSGTAIAFFNKMWALPAAVILLSLIMGMPVEYSVAAHVVFPFIIGLLYYIILKNDIIKKIFSYKVIPVIGGMCYSIYLLHYTIISVFGRYTISIKVTDYYLPNLIFQIVVLAIPILIISSVFYMYVERPFMDNKWMKLLLKKDKVDESESGATINI